MDFEFDPKKSEANLARHGIDFIEARALWADCDLVELLARTAEEPRYLVVARIGKKHWSGVITYREERIRIISVRRSRPEEVRIYENNRKDDNG